MEEKYVPRSGTMGLTSQPVLSEHLSRGRLRLRLRVRLRVRLRLRTRLRLRLSFGLGLGVGSDPEQLHLVCS